MVSFCILVVKYDILFLLWFKEKNFELLILCRENIFNIYSYIGVL